MSNKSFTELPSEAEIELRSEIKCDEFYGIGNRGDFMDSIHFFQCGMNEMKSIAEKAIAYEQWKAEVFAEWTNSRYNYFEDYGWLDVGIDTPWESEADSYEYSTTTELYNCDAFKEYLEKRRKEEGK